MKPSKLLLSVLVLFTALVTDAQTATNLPLVLIRLATAGAGISESGASNTVIINRETTNQTANLTVNYTISGAALNGIDYSTLPSSVTIPAGTNRVLLPLVAIDDTEKELLENIILQLQPTEEYRTNSVSNKVIIPIADNDNSAPVVHFITPTNNSTFTVPTNILLKAEAADSDGTVRKVEFLKNGVVFASVTNNGSGHYSYIWTNAPAGNYALQARATDNLEARESSAVVNIVVHGSTTPATTPPYAFLLSPTNNSEFTEGATITLTSKTYDVDGYVKTIQFLNGTNVMHTISNATSVGVTNIHHLQGSFPVGEYSFKVRAIDNEGATRTSEASFVRVVSPTNEVRPIVTVMATDSEAAEPGAVGTVLNTASFTISRRENTNVVLTIYYTLRGTASTGVDYIELPQSITLPSGKTSTNILVRPIHDTLPEDLETVVLTLQPPLCVETVFPVPAKCYIIGEAREAVARIIDNDQITNQPPTVRLLTPTNNAVYLAKTNIHLTAEASDADGQVARVEFFAGDLLLGSRTEPPYSLIWSNVPAGTFKVKAKAIDDKGASRISEPAQITIRSLVEISFVKRTLPVWYVPDVKLRVQLRAEPRTNTTNYVVFDTPPAGWLVQPAGELGVVNNGTIKFGPFNDNKARTFIYDVTPPEKETGEKKFLGEAVANGTGSPIMGAAVLAMAPPHPADTNSELWSMSVGESVAYGEAWQHSALWGKGPNPIPVNYATRAGFLAQSGGLYVLSSHTPSPIAPLLWIPAIAESGETSANDLPWVTNRLATAISTMPTNYVVGVPFTVTIAVTPTASVKAHALEEAIPLGFAVTNISAGGIFSHETRKIRWGVYLDAEPLTVSYQVVALTNSPNSARFAGVVSCNGVNQPVTGQRETRRVTLNTAARLEGVKILADGQRLFTFIGEPGVSYVLEGCNELGDWQPMTELVNSDGSLQYIDLAPTDSVKFYRAVPRE